MKTTVTHRIEALDIFRALTMFFMLFVNDIPGLKNIPHGLLHAKWDEDMLGFSDTIFPGFLFALGMAIPYAIQNRMKKGDTLPQVGRHIFWRIVALLVMGLYTVNLETLDATATGMSNPCFTLWMVLGFFLIWSVYPKVTDWKRYLFSGMKSVGILLLIYLFSIYKGVDGVPFSTQWWGILGLIGWTYAVCALLFLLTRESVLWNSLALGMLLLCSVCSASGVFDEWAFVRLIPSNVTLHAFGMAGVWAAVLMQKYADKKHPVRFFMIMGAIGALMLIAAIVVHPYWIISKLQATPTWFFFCCSIFFPLFALVYWLTDVKGKSAWFAILKPAGTVTLTCYVIPYVWYSVQDLLQVNYPPWMESGIPGLLKSVAFSLSVIGIAWILMKMKVRLKI